MGIVSALTICTYNFSIRIINTKTPFGFLLYTFEFGLNCFSKRIHVFFAKRQILSHEETLHSGITVSVLRKGLKKTVHNIQLDGVSKNVGRNAVETLKYTGRKGNAKYIHKINITFVHYYCICTVHVVRSLNCHYQHMHNFNVID